MRSSNSDKVVVIFGTILAETEKAILVAPNKEIHEEYQDGTENSTWFPLSQVTKILRRPKDGLEDDQIIVTAWIAKQKGFDV